MAVATQEHKEYNMLHMVNRMVWEAKRNDEIARKYADTVDSDIFPSTEKLLMSLTRQAPNRIYFSPDGRVCRVLFFSEEGMPYQARIETLQLDNNRKVLKSECVVSESPAGLEQEIIWWRRQFSMSGDLLSNPLLVLESIERNREVIHIGGTERRVGTLTAVDNLVYCRYYQSSLNGPRFVDLGLGSNYKVNEEEILRNLDDPPPFILRHLNPFSDFIPIP